MEFWISGFVLFVLFMTAVTIHEVSHGLVAEWLGDSTARKAGRLTLNPLRHVDPFGTLLLPLLLRLVNSPFIFGWAKPVPVNAMNFRNPRRDMLWVGAAGPAANFLLAMVVAGLLQMGRDRIPVLLFELGRTLALINLVLGTFNLLPIPPLDGSRILGGLLPGSWTAGVMMLERWGFWLILLLMAVRIDKRVLEPVILGLARWMGLVP
jgi:Zn-dependent protease